MKNKTLIIGLLALTACSRPEKEQVLLVSKVEYNSSYMDSTDHCGCTGAYLQKYQFMIDGFTSPFYTNLEIKPADTVILIPARMLRAMEEKKSAGFQADTTTKEIKYW